MSLFVYYVICVISYVHIKETEISQKRSMGIKNWKITYSVILNVLSNNTNLILGFSSPLTIFCCELLIYVIPWSPWILLFSEGMYKPRISLIAHARGKFFLFLLNFPLAYYMQVGNLVEHKGFLCLLIFPDQHSRKINRQRNSLLSTKQ